MCPNFVISDFSRFHLIFNLTFYVLNLMEELISQSTLGWFYQCITSSFCACRSQKAQKDIDCLFLTVFFRFWDLIRASRKHVGEIHPLLYIRVFCSNKESILFCWIAILHCSVSSWRFDCRHFYYEWIVKYSFKIEINHNSIRLNSVYISGSQPFWTPKLTSLSKILEAVLSSFHWQS